ncbi:MAG: DUF6516 family protein [Pseudomonadota bacterium]|nr:DUF6516 family protein [Pseudomonadota bacterium]
MDVRRYLDEVRARLATSAAITAIEVVTEQALSDRGYFRARLSLANGDFLEVSAYFMIRRGKPETVEYRYQWMDPAQQRLIRRWDNARHFPKLPQFPHHMHVGDEKQVVPGQALSILTLVDLIEQELGVKGS